MLEPHGKSLISKAILGSALVIPSIGAGMFLGRWECFKFTPHITLGQILQVCTLLFIGVVANWVYAKAHGSRSKRVEILSGMVGEILDCVKHIHSIVIECHGKKAVPRAKQRLINGGLRNYGNAVRELEMVLENLPRIRNSPDFTALQHDREEYRDTVTGQSFPVNLALEQFLEASRLYPKIRSNLHRFQLLLTELV